MAVALPRKAVAEEVAPDPAINFGGEHQRVKGMVRRLEEPVIAQELVDSVRQSGVVAVAREPARAFPDRRQADAGKGYDLFA